jgi:Flp pilus assembly protein TadD
LAVAFSPDGKTVLTGGGIGAQLWSATTGKELTLVLWHPAGAVRGVAFSPDGKTMITASWHEVRLWSAATGKVLTPALRHPSQVLAVAFSPDGQAVLTGSFDGRARLWSAATGKELTPPLPHQSEVLDLVFGPDGKMVLTGNWADDERNALHWAQVVGKGLPPTLDQRVVLAMAFSPDGKAVLTGSKDKTARLWQMPMAVKGDAKQINLWTQVLTGTEIDDHGNLHVLDAQTWQQRREQFVQVGGTPITKEVDVLVWHRREAIEAELAGRWFAAAWHLTRLIETTPDDGQLWTDRGQAHAQLEQWDKASLDFGKACQLGEPDLPVWTQHALLRLHLRDAKGYQRACATLTQRFGAVKEPGIMKTVAWTCALAPNAVADLKPIVRLAEKAGEGQPNDPNHLNTLGAILYRAGRYEEAVKWLKEAVAKSPAKKGVAADWLFLAMAQQKLGHTEEAKSFLTRAGEFKKAKDLPWTERLELQILHKEAEALVKGTKR